MLDAGSGRVVRTVAVSGAPHALAIDETSGRVFVAKSPGRGFIRGSVSMLDARSGTVLRTIVPTTGDVVAVAVDDHTGHVFVVNNDTRGTVSVFDARTGGVLQSIIVGQGAQAIAVDTRHSRAFVLRGCGLAGPGSVSVLDTRRGRVLRIVAVGLFPSAIAVTAQFGRVFVTNGYGSGGPTAGWEQVLDRVLAVVRRAPSQPARATNGTVSVFDATR